MMENAGWGRTSTTGPEVPPFTATVLELIACAAFQYIGSADEWGVEEENVTPQQRRRKRGHGMWQCYLLDFVQDKWVV